MYESPICLAIGEVSNEIVKKQDDMIFTEVTNMIGVQVDKDELLKALAYDRDQYDKGYQEGHIDGFAKAEKMYARPHGEWKQITEPDIWGKTKYQCSVCKYVHRHSEFDTISFCENCGADMREEGEAK